MRAFKEALREYENRFKQNCQKRFERAKELGIFKDWHPIVLCVKTIGGDVPIDYEPKAKDFPARF